ncbi:hypothetical protein CBS101457_006431 [Exobasidium rhododendri]|nr:hypothetical protein CBS101457_006431 [Exobasidium rhododendri]
MSQSLIHVLGQAAASPVLGTLLSGLGEGHIELTQKRFGAVSYRSSQSHGISLQFEEVKSEWRCKAVDVYNQNGAKGWSRFCALPIRLSFSGQDDDAISLHLNVNTTGVDLVRQLGEPQRKGGGEPMKGGGASGLGPGAWMEWNLKYEGKSVEVMIELAGQGARGKDRWEKERAGGAEWGVATFALAE